MEKPDFAIHVIDSLCDALLSMPEIGRLYAPGKVLANYLSEFLHCCYFLHHRYYVQYIIIVSQPRPLFFFYIGTGKKGLAKWSVAIGDPML